MTMWQLYIAIRRILVFAVGSTVLSIGIVLLFTPGPAFVVIPVGLAILAFEFAWARRWLRKVRAMLGEEGTPPRRGTHSLSDSSRENDG